MNEINRAIILANKTLQEVPAYKNFVRKNGFNKTKISTKEDFFNLPVTSKKNYIQNYKISELFNPQQALPVAFASSGSSGTPTFWFRNEEQEKQATKTHQIILSKIFGIRKHETTLVVICFSMGIWVAGNFTYAAFRELAKQGYKITIITPGIDKNDIFSTLTNLAPHYKNLILAGYPPFIMDAIQGCKSHAINLPSRTRILTAGDTFSEGWRNKIAELTTNEHLTDTINLYGSADGGILGHETPLSIHIRRLAKNNEALSQFLFGDPHSEPAFVQYNPDNIYFEEREGELVFTTNTGIPLIRYNIRDIGTVHSLKNVKQTLLALGLMDNKLSKMFKQWRYPFIAKKGRADVAVTYYALNIFPEHIRAGVEDKRIDKFLTGSFVAYNQVDKHHKNHSLHIVLELLPNVNKKKAPQQEITEIITEQLLKHNIEYKKLYSTIGETVKPIIHLVRAGDNAFQGAKGLQYLKGKKPKLAL